MNCVLAFRLQRPFATWRFPMRLTILFGSALLGLSVIVALAQGVQPSTTKKTQPAPTQPKPAPAATAPGNQTTKPADPAAEAVAVRKSSANRPELQLTDG